MSEMNCQKMQMIVVRFGVASMRLVQALRFEPATELAIEFKI
jgi:hypothetical protein